MKRDPQLRTRVYTEDGTKYRMTVHGGLHHIRGNHQPYFSLTADIDRQGKNGRWYESSGGCQHEAILKFYPDLQPLAALHLSDLDGVPTHAEADGWYWYEGGYWTTRRAPQAWTGGSPDAQPPPPSREFHPATSPYRYGQPLTREDQVKLLANHLRITPQAAEELLDRQLTREQFGQFVEAQRPRWKQEAEDAIQRFQLVIYGDPWPPPPPAEDLP